MRWLMTRLPHDRPPAGLTPPPATEGTTHWHTFGHITRDRCDQLGRALTTAGLSWNDNGRQDQPAFLTYTAIDAHGRKWSISPATSNQITPSRPASIWQAQCAAPTHRTPILSARAVADHIRAFPA